MHVEALRALFATEVPHSVSIRLTDRGKIRYVIGDASSKGFVSGISGTQYPDLTFEGWGGLWEVFFSQGGSSLWSGVPQTMLFGLMFGQRDCLPHNIYFI